MPLDTISVLPVHLGWHRCASLSLGWRRCATLCHMGRTCATQPRWSHLGEVLPLCAAPPWDPKWLICATPSHPPGAYAPWLPPCANALGMSTWRICARWSVWSSHAGRQVLRGYQRDPLAPTHQTAVPYWCTHMFTALAGGSPRGVQSQGPLVDHRGGIL